MESIKNYSRSFDRIMDARLKGQSIVEAGAIIGIAIYLSMFLEKTDTNIRSIVNSKPVIALSIAGCLTIANHRPMLSLMIAIAYLAILSVTNKKAEAERFAAFHVSSKPNFVTSFTEKVANSNTQLAATGSTMGTMSNLYPEAEPVDYIELSGQKQWSPAQLPLSPLAPAEEY